MQRSSLSNLHYCITGLVRAGSSLSDARVVLERCHIAAIVVISWVSEPSIPVITHAPGLLQPRGCELLLSLFLSLEDL